MVRVLPADCMFDPSTAETPSCRIIRVRNIVNEDISVSCQLAHRVIRTLDAAEQQMVSSCEVGD